ncbi:MAG: hypothetical protein WA005_04885 [Candidatus Binataceae bacterium]
MTRKTWALTVALAAAFVAPLTCMAAPDGVRHVGVIPPAQIPAAITAAIDAPDRPAADKQLDAGRRPDQIMAFFGIAPGMKVFDLFAGGGYTTELLSRIVGPSGKVYSQNGDFPPKFKKIEDAWKNRLRQPALANVVAVSKPFNSDDPLPVPPGSLDAVITHLNYHALVARGVDRGKLNRQIFAALKPGGVYAIVDHSAQVGSGVRDAGTLHRIDENFAIKEVEQAGFKLAATSGALRHPEDDRTWFVSEHRGATDRFMLKFVKPAG